MNRYEACNMLARMKAGLTYPPIDGFSNELNACRMLFSAWCKLNQVDQNREKEMFKGFPRQNMMEHLIDFFNNNQNSPLNLIMYDADRHGPRQLISAACMTQNEAYETIAYLAYRISKMTNSEWLSWIDDRTAAILMMQLHMKINGTNIKTASNWMAAIDLFARNNQNLPAPYFSGWREVMQDKPVDPLAMLMQFCDSRNIPHYLLWQAVIEFTAKDIVVKKVQGLRDVYLAKESMK